jgi:death-on-curing protein
MSSKKPPLWESLSQNHPFVDANKRVAVTATAAFLRMNGYRLSFDDSDAIAFLLGLYAANARHFTAIETSLREHAVPAPPPD